MTINGKKFNKTEYMKLYMRRVRQQKKLEKYIKYVKSFGYKVEKQQVEPAKKDF